MVTLLWELRHNMEYFPLSPGSFRIIVHRVSAEEFSHVNRRLHNLKYMDLTLPPRSSPNICIHQRKESKEGVRSTEVIVCLENRQALIDVSRTLRNMNYKICQASIAKYHVSYEFLMGRVNRSKQFIVETVFDVDDEWMKMHEILKIAKERECPETNMELSVLGPSEELHDDLMRSFHYDLVVTGGQVFRGGWEYGTELSVRSGELVFFTTKKSAAGAG